jgi:dipeptidase D
VNRILSELEPKSVFRHFEDLTKIPRESGNEEMISNFLKEFANKNNLKSIQEDCLNVIIEKPASPGYEDAPKVILQGHMDMVCVKKADLDFDFEKDSIPVIIDGDLIKTTGTTLGADNGIALAMIMAILESKEINHPAITALFTSTEETGMVGAMELSAKNISGEILINLDTEEEGVALTSCAGGINTIVNLPVVWEIPTLKEPETLKIEITGLLGGHSGVEINKNRANAIKLMGRVLNSINKNLQSKIQIADIGGGDKMNAIAIDSYAVVVAEASEIEKIKKIVSVCQNEFLNEFNTSDSNILISIENIDLPKSVFSDATKDSLIRILLLIPNGVQTMSSDIEGLVESSNNIGVLTVENDEIIFNSAVRSSVGSLKNEITARIESMAEICGATVRYQSNYPEWEYRPESKIRDLMISLYKKKYGSDLEVGAIHAGLECGLLKEKLGDIDMISIGPELYDVHTVNERLSISSTNRVFEFLCDVLTNIN